MFSSNCAPKNIPKGVFLLPLSLFLLVLLLPLLRSLNQSSSKIYTSSLKATESKRCNIFSGNWVPNPEGPYYNNETCPLMLDQLNCIKNEKPNRGFLNLRWKPHDCELPLFDAAQFMNLVRGKSMAFLGDSMGRNQMESLLCLINSIAHPEDVTAKYTSYDDAFFRWKFSSDYNFTLATLFSPFLVRYIDAAPNGRSFNSSMNLYLDQVDKAWTSKIQKFDYLIVSTGQWFYRPLTFYENGKIVGYQTTTDFNLYGYRKAFQTALKAIISVKGFKGLTFLVTHSPKHFENGEWYEGGTCDRTKPFTVEDKQTYHYRDVLEAFHRTQVEEFAEAEIEARKKGLRFGLIDITDAMVMRPDAHPNRYGRVYDKNVKVTDCVHWCAPGPIDTWNEFLLYLMKLKDEKHNVITM